MATNQDRTSRSHGGTVSRVPLGKKTVAAFAVTAGPSVMFSLPFSVYLPPYIAAGGAIPVALVGVLFSLTTIWDGIIDPLIGSMIDRVDTRTGAHMRWMIRGIIPLLLLLLVILTVGDRLPFLALLPVLLLFYSSFSLYDVAQLSWGAALVGNPDESARLFGARDWYAKLVFLAAFAAPALAQQLIPGLDLQGRILAYSSLVLLTLPLALLAIRRLPSRPVGAAPGIGWRAEIRASLTFKPLMLLFGINLCNSFAFGSLTALFIYFADAVLGLDGQSALILFSSFVGGAIAVPIWTQLARRFGKPLMLIAMGGFVSVALLSSLVIAPTGLVQALIFAMVLGSGFVGTLFAYAMLSDLMAEDRARCHRDRTAFLFSIVNLMQKFGVAAAIGTSYILLDWMGFDPQHARESAEQVHLIFAIMPALAWGTMVILLLQIVREPAFAIVRPVSSPAAPL